MTDLLLGACDLYTWKDVRVWAKSAREHFNGDIKLLMYRGDMEIIEKCKDLGIEVYSADFDPFGNAIDHNNRGRNTQSHQMRFFHFWQFLQDQNYDLVLSTDVRDVLFQADPMKFIRDHHLLIEADIVASSESVIYEVELWGEENIRNGFGEYVAEFAEDWPIYNVGVVAGKMEAMAKLFFTIYQMGNPGRYIPNDQSSYNILVNYLCKDWFTRVDHDMAYACQAGTTLDRGKSYYWHQLLAPQPKIENGIAYTAYGEKFSIFHQWDRTDARDVIEKRYI